MKDSLKKAKETFNNLKATPKGRAILFFGFYLIFFLIIILVCSININNSGDNNYERSKLDGVELGNLKDNNYSFTYTNTIDLDSYIYKGERYKDLSLYKYNNTYYFSNKDKNYINNSNIWEEVNNPNTYNYFTDVDNINNILNNSTYISKTDYESGKVIYNYEISTTTLIKLINNIEVDLDDKSNEIIISTDEDKNINKINFILDSYGLYNKICKVKFNIDLEYDKIGEIKEIENPIK